MCLSIAVYRPQDVLSSGVHRGYEWMTVHNGNGSRCGYVRVPKGHPWHGKDFAGSWDEDYSKPPSVHGGITFSRPDMPCGKGGADDAYWQGFDCDHSGDAPDPELPREVRSLNIPDLASIFDDLSGPRGIIRTQDYVESECRRLADQAVAAADAAGFVMDDDGGHDHHHVACEVGQ